MSSVVQEVLIRPPRRSSPPFQHRWVPGAFQGGLRPFRAALLGLEETRQRSFLPRLYQSGEVLQLSRLNSRSLRYEPILQLFFPGFLAFSQFGKEPGMLPVGYKAGKRKPGNIAFGTCPGGQKGDWNDSIRILPVP